VPGAAVPAPPGAPGRPERAYTFLLVRRDEGNASCNANFLQALVASAGGLTPDKDPYEGAKKIPALEHRAFPDTDEEAGLYDDPIFHHSNAEYYAALQRDNAMWERSRVAEVVSELVALTVAETGGLFETENAPLWSTWMEPENGARWLAHRKLLWRSQQFRPARARAPTILPVDMDRCWADALGATATAAVRHMVARAAQRDAERPDIDEVIENPDAAGACALCGAADGEDVLGKLLTFKGEDGVNILVHNACASCSSEVFYDAQGRHLNVLKAVSRGKHIQCALGGACGAGKKSGATVGCAVAKCRKSYHVRCCLATGWHFGPARGFYCPQHRVRNYDPEDMDDESWFFDCACGKSGLNYDDGTAMWACGTCDAWQHAKCAGGAEDAECPEDYVCWKCAGSP